MLSHGLKGPQMVYPRYPSGPSSSYTPTRRLKEASPPSGEGPHGSGEGHKEAYPQMVYPTSLWWPNHLSSINMQRKHKLDSSPPSIL